MATCDITSHDTEIKGVHSPINFIRSEAHIIDGSEFAGLLEVDTHKLFTIPKGNMLTSLKIVSLDTATSGGAATVQFSVAINGTAESVGTAIGVSDLANGDVAVLNINAIKGYDELYDTDIQMTVGTAALTKFKVLVIAEYIPVIEFITAG